MIPNTMRASTSTINGLRAGLPCSACWSRSAGLRPRLSRSSTAAGFSASLLVWVMAGPPHSGCRTGCSRGAPALLRRVGRGLARDALHGAGGRHLGPGVDERLAGRIRGRLAARGDPGNGAHTQLRHLAGVLHRVRGEDPALDQANALAAAVDGDDEGLLLPAGRLQGCVSALTGRLVDAV